MPGLAQLIAYHKVEIERLERDLSIEKCVLVELQSVTIAKPGRRTETLGLLTKILRDAGQPMRLKELCAEFQKRQQLAGARLQTYEMIARCINNHNEVFYKVGHGVYTLVSPAIPESPGNAQNGTEAKIVKEESGFEEKNE